MPSTLLSLYNLHHIYFLYATIAVLKMTHAANTIFLSRFSVMDAMPHFRQVIQNSFDIKRMVYVPTAAYCLDPRNTRGLGDQRRRARYDARQKAALLAASFSVTDFTLLELDAVDITADIISKKMENADMIYVDGGNTFYLQKHIIQSSFWHAINPFLDKGGLYIGASAGAIVAGRSIRTAEWKGWDDPGVAGEEYEWTEERMTGRGLRDYSVFMHYNEDAHLKLVTDKSVDLDHRVKIVPDDNALIHFNENVFNSRISNNDNNGNNNNGSINPSTNIFTLTSNGAIP